MVLERLREILGLVHHSLELLESVGLETVCAFSRTRRKTTKAIRMTWMTSCAQEQDTGGVSTESYKATPPRR
ncbi:MAG: hypothetical protein MZV70_57615 [Desulfobacterales bacterium]|nr:hypothetical protein [Desulfobacterales bacterium]